jgi:hypothetical protein
MDDLERLVLPRLDVRGCHTGVPRSCPEVPWSQPS